MGEWKKVSMKDNLEILTGYAFSSKNFNEEEGIPLIRIRDLETHNPVTLYKGDYDDKYIINKGDILVGMDGEFNIVRWKGPNALLNQRVAKINSRNPDIISEDFIFYRLQGELRKIETLTPATTVKHLSKKDIEDLNLLLPPLGEQSKVASILSSVDEAIEKTEAIIEQTEKVKKGLMQQLLTKGIGHTKFKKTEIGEIPEGWEVVTIGDISQVTKLAGFEFTEYMEYVEDGEIIAIRGLNIKDGSLVLDDVKRIRRSVSEKLPRSQLHKDDLVMTYVGTIGEVAIIQESGKYHLAPNVAKITLNNGIPRYLFYYLKSQLAQREISRMLTTTSQPALSMGNIRKIRVALPSTKEQEMISQILCSFDQKLTHERKNLVQLQTLKKGLMQVLLTGKVRVKVDDEVMSQ